MFHPSIHPLKNKRLFVYPKWEGFGCNFGNGEKHVPQMAPCCYGTCGGGSETLKHWEDL